MRVSMTAAAVAGALFLTACGGGDDEDQAAGGAAPSSQPPGDDVKDREKALTVAAQGYVDAMLKGRIAGVIGYLDPQVCDDEDESEYALSMGPMAEVAEGATMKIRSVYVDGDRGGVEDYELSKGAPDQLRRLLKVSFTGDRQYSWNYRDGEWYLAGPCKDDESASPETS